MRDRRERAAAAFHDGILLLHANSELDINADGFRQDPFFYYFTGLENTVGALLAIDGRAGESWLFLNTKPPSFLAGVLQPEVRPGTDSEKRLDIEHVLDWSKLQDFLASRAKPGVLLYYANDSLNFSELPANLVSHKSSEAPTWLQVLLLKWPAFDVKEVGAQVQSLMDVQSSDELAALRSAATATVKAFMAGVRAVRPGVSQRSVEAAVENLCWKAGAHGSAGWPWAMAGANAVYPRPWASLGRYDHLNRTVRAGDLMRLDVGCEWNHYGGDLGRTVPVSGRFSDDQREIWNIFVAAYQAGAAVLRSGVTADQVFDAWRAVLVQHRTSAKTLLAKRAIDSWSDRKNVPYWQVHTTTLSAGFLVGPLREGTTINFEPMASIDGQAFFLEDMYLVTKTGAVILTPGVPYSADDIEAAMR